MPALPAPLIALISAVPAAVPPIRAAIDEQIPSARVWNILDDRLLQDATEQGGLTPHLEGRMRRLIEHALAGGADGIVLTCSLYGPVAAAAAADGASSSSENDSCVPILGPDDAVIAEATSGAYRHILVVSSAADPLADSLTRIGAAAGNRVAVSGVVAQGAAAAARTGDLAALTGIIADSVTAASRDTGSLTTAAPAVDAIVLGQYSLAPAAPSVQAATGLPTLAGPAYAVTALREHLHRSQLTAGSS